jgi:hypothetical protein
MVTFKYSTEDLEDFYKAYPDVEMTLNGDQPHISRYVGAFRSFLLGVGFTQNVVDNYVPECDEI